MGRVYQACRFCGGAVTEQRVTVYYRWGDEFLVVIRDVPAGVCRVCGEQYFKAEIVKAMEKVAQREDGDKEFLRIPVRALKVA